MSFATGFSETMFTVPVTRGSRTKVLPVRWPTVLITAWMSAFTELSVNFSSSAARARQETRARPANRPRAELRKVLTFSGFLLDFTDILLPKPGFGQGGRPRLPWWPAGITRKRDWTMRTLAPWL